MISLFSVCGCFEDNSIEDHYLTCIFGYQLVEHLIWVNCDGCVIQLDSSRVRNIAGVYVGCFVWSWSLASLACPLATLFSANNSHLAYRMCRNHVSGESRWVWCWTCASVDLYSLVQWPAWAMLTPIKAVYSDQQVDLSDCSSDKVCKRIGLSFCLCTLTICIIYNFHDEQNMCWGVQMGMAISVCVKWVDGARAAATSPSTIQATNDVSGPKQTAQVNTVAPLWVTVKALLLCSQALGVAALGCFNFSLVWYELYSDQSRTD